MVGEKDEEQLSLRAEAHDLVDRGLTAHSVKEGEDLSRLSGKKITHLLEAVDKGLSLHPELRSAMAEVERARTTEDMSKGGYLPRLELSAGPENAIFGDLGYDVTLSQMLYDWGRVDSKVEAASASRRQKIENLLVVREDAALEIAEAYLDVLLYSQRVSAADSYRSRLQELQGLILERASNGYADRSEEGRIELALARAGEQLSIERGSLQDAEQQYGVLVGEPPGYMSEPADPAIISRLFANADKLETALEHAPLFRKAREDVAIAEADVRQAEVSLLPQLNLEGSLQRREIGSTLTEDSVIALRLRMDAIQGLSNFQRPDAERQRLEAARWTLDTMKRDLRRKLISISETESVLRWREKSLVSQVAEATKISGVYRDQFLVSMRDITDLISIESEHFEAERELSNVRSERLRAQYRAASQVGWLVPLFEGREFGGI